jgi:SAM-dependent methyltransferase
LIQALFPAAASEPDVGDGYTEERDPAEDVQEDSAYPRFQVIQAEESAAVFDAGLLDGVLPLFPELPERLRAGIDVLGVGCGYGHALNLMAQAYPASRFTGYDLSDEGVAAGRSEAEALHQDPPDEICRVAASLSTVEAPGETPGTHAGANSRRSISAARSSTSSRIVFAPRGRSLALFPRRSYATTGRDRAMRGTTCSQPRCDHHPP